MLILLATLACNAPEEVPTDAPTWTDDVAPLVVDHCATCHQAGGIGVFPLTSYDDAKVVAAAMADAVSSRRMPPWSAEADCNRYEGDLSLSDEEIATITDWVEAGAPEGASSAPLLAPAPQVLQNPDLVLSMPELYTPSGEGGDDYRCFVVDWPYDDDVYVTAYDVQPGNTAVVHHLVAYIIDPEYADSYAGMDEDGAGYTCFGGPGGSAGNSARWLGAWAPGGDVNEMPEGVGIPVQGGSKIVLQMHYNTDAAGPQPDQTGMLLRVADTVDIPAEITPWANPRWIGTQQMRIPAGESGVNHDFDYRLREGTTVYSVSLHMHRLGQSAGLTIHHSDASETCLLQIPEWDFNWQRSYRLAEPVVMEQGDVVNLSCNWDNPTDSDVFWGDGTNDEMCLSTMLVAY